MPFSVYIAKPPAGGDCGPHIYKVGKTTEEDVQSRIAALNDAGSNYPTANGENWELVDHFNLANQEQMDAFESAMAAHLGTGLDPQGTGATELFESAALDADVHDAALTAVKSLAETGLVDVGAVANLAAEHGTAAAATAAAHLDPSTDDLTEDAVNLIAELVWEGRDASVGTRLRENSATALAAYLRPLASRLARPTAPRLRVTLSEYVDLLRAMATAQAAPAAEPPDRVARWIARTASLRKRPRAYGRSNRCNSGPPSAASNCARHHLPT